MGMKSVRQGGLLRTPLIPAPPYALPRLPEAFSAPWGDAHWSTSRGHALSPPLRTRISSPLSSYWRRWVVDKAGYTTSPLVGTVAGPLKIALTQPLYSPEFTMTISRLTLNHQPIISE